MEENEGPVRGDTGVRGRAVVKEDHDDETHGAGGGVEEVNGAGGQGRAHRGGGGGGSAGESSR